MIKRLKDMSGDMKGIFNFFSEWVTRFNIDGRTLGGKVDLTNDHRIRVLNTLYPLEGKRVLELGCLECAHTMMVHNFGCKEIIAIEGRVENYVKSCVMKNLLDLNRCKIIYADLRNERLEKYGKFDVCICIGVLYHVPNPDFLMEQISKVTDRVFIWTHYAVNEYPKGKVIGHKGYKGKTYIEGNLAQPSSGLQPTSFWLFENDLYTMIRDSGFPQIQVLEKGELYEWKARHVLLFASKEEKHNKSNIAGYFL